MEPVRISVKKRKSAQHQDTVTIQHADVTCVLRAWQQGILPHELEHDRRPQCLLAEALTNAFQYEIWGMGQPGNDGLRVTLDQHGMDTGDAEVPLDVDLERVRARLLELAAAWAQLGPGEALSLEMRLERSC